MTNPIGRRRFDPAKMAAKQAAQKQRQERRNVPMNELGAIGEFKPALDILQRIADFPSTQEGQDDWTQIEKGWEALADEARSFLKEFLPSGETSPAA